MKYNISAVYSTLGNYWLDPNEGAPEDALLVYCDLEKKSSCIFPVTPKVFYRIEEIEVVKCWNCVDRLLKSPAIVNFILVMERIC